MATSVTSYVETYDDRNAPSPKYLTAPNTWQLVRTIVSELYQISQSSSNSIITWNNGTQVSTRSYQNMLFNQPIRMSDDETTAVGLLSGSGSIYTFSHQTNENYINIPVPQGRANLYNSEVIIGKNVTDCTYMFSSCEIYNKKVIIPNKVQSCSHMFSFANIFNQPIALPNSVTNCYAMFYCANSFNQPITIPDSVLNCMDMFRHTQMNAPVKIGNNVTDCTRMFGGTNSWESYEPPKMLVNDLYIPKSVNNAVDMFRGCKGRPKNIYINQVGRTQDINLCGMFLACNRYTTVNVYCNNLAVINGTGTNDRNSLFNGSIQYAVVPNGQYNATYNIYLYYNYSG